VATQYWIGAAKAVAQIGKVTFSAYTSGQTYTITVNGKSISYTAVASTEADVCGGLVSAWNAATDAEFVEAIATYSTGVVLTARTAGIPFTVTASATTGSATVTTPTAATGPNHADNAKNWASGSVPSSSDDVVLRNSDVSIKYGLDWSAINIASLTIEASFTGDVGLPAKNASGYPEYRSRYWKLTDGTGSMTLIVGRGDGQGSSRINIDANAETIVGTIYATNRPQVAGDRALDLKNTDSSSTLIVYAGSVGLTCDSSGAAASLSVLRSSQASQQPDVLIAAGVTVTSVKNIGGHVTNYGTMTTVDTQESGITDNYNAAPTVKVASRGLVNWLSSAGIGTKLYVYQNGSIDFGRHSGTKTVAAVDLYAGGSIIDSLGIVTYTTGIVLVGGKVGDSTIDVGRSRTLSIS